MNIACLIIVSLSIVTIATWHNAHAAAPELGLTASKALTGMVVVDPQVSGLFQELDQTLKDSPEHFRPEEITFVKNMVFLAASEFSLVRSVDSQGNFSVPLRLTAADFRLAALKYDTLEGGSCYTPIRIIRQKKIFSSDIFLFEGDAAKYRQIDPDFLLKSSVGSKSFSAAYDKYAKDQQQSTRAPLAKGLLGGKFSRFEAVLHWSRLQFVTQQPEGDILLTATTILQLYGFTTK